MRLSNKNRAIEGYFEKGAACLSILCGSYFENVYTCTCYIITSLVAASFGDGAAVTFINLLNFSSRFGLSLQKLLAPKGWAYVVRMHCPANGVVLPTYVEGQTVSSRGFPFFGYKDFLTGCKCPSPLISEGGQSGLRVIDCIRWCSSKGAAYAPERGG